MASGETLAGPPALGPVLDATAPVETGRTGLLRSLLDLLKAHPVICLLLLTPGILEYLSSSSPLEMVVLNPGQFLFQLAANLGLYGPGVLLVREAAVRWNKGWATVLVLGAAYGIVEEGLGLGTLFYPKAGPVGEFGYYGHWLGVSWIWSAIVLPVHMLFSVSLPILLLGLALPATRGTSFLPRRKVWAALAILVVDVSLLFTFVLTGEHFWMGYPVLAGSMVAVGALILLARSMPPGPFSRTTLPQKRPRTMALLGLIFYPTILLATSLAMTLLIPPAVDFVLVLLVQALFLAVVLRVGGSTNNEPQLIALAFGLILPIAAIGLIATVGSPLVLVADLAMALFFRTLWRMYRVPVGHPTEPAISTPSGKGLSQIGRRFS